MLVFIIFGLLFLIGFSFLITLLGTSFLRRHSVRMPDRTAGGQYRVGSAGRVSAGPAAQPIPLGGEHRGGYDEGFARSGPSGGAASAPSMPQSFPQAMYPAPAASAGGRWAFLLPVVVVVVALVLLFGLREFMGGGARPRLYFCENVDFAKLRPIRSGDTFTRGNVTIFMKSKSPLLLERVFVEVYDLGSESLEPYMDKELRLKPEWTSFSVKALFDTIGSYKVSVYNSDDLLITQRNINIVPDELAYRPVSAR
jgi:hypothetical protein